MSSVAFRWWSALGAGAAALAALVALGPPAPGAHAEPHKPVLIELFTSQGCSSCPQANAFLGQLAKEPDTVALTYAVGYWDYLGWRDTFAKPDFAARQKRYAANFRRGVYTPQMVINGAAHTSGLRPSDVRDLTASTSMLGGARIDAQRGEGRAQVTIVGAPPAEPSEVWLAQYQPGPLYVSITRGENAGFRMPHYNVVTKLQRLGPWAGGAQRYEGACAPACAVIVQQINGDRVLAAAFVAPRVATAQSGGAPG